MANDISQEEIDALFGDVLNSSSDQESNNSVEMLTDSEKDVLGEVGNISMGAAATTLSTLLNQKVNITTPHVVQQKSLKSLLQGDDKYVAINIKYKAGLDGSFLLVIKEEDVKYISNVMMGANTDDSKEPITDMQISAISEAMNQMVGSSCTSMSSIFNTPVDIQPPEVDRIDFDADKDIFNINLISENYVVVEFDLLIGDSLNSKMVQVLPIDVSKQLIKKLTGGNGEEVEVASEEVEPAITESKVSVDNVEHSESVPERPQASATMDTTRHVEQYKAPREVSNVNFETLVQERVDHAKEQISLLQDVGLEVVVELGRTNKSIKEILEFGPGVVIELNKMAGEPIDILINNKFIAKGEVVVIDENFGIRITEIIDVNKRI